MLEFISQSTSSWKIPEFGSVLDQSIPFHLLEVKSTIETNHLIAGDQINIKVTINQPPNLIIPLDKNSHFLALIESTQETHHDSPSLSIELVSTHTHTNSYEYLVSYKSPPFDHKVHFYINNIELTSGLCNITLCNFMVSNFTFCFITLFIYLITLNSISFVSLLRMNVLSFI